MIRCYRPATLSSASMALALAACGGADVSVWNRLEEPVRVGVGVPLVEADCDLPIAARYCREEYRRLELLTLDPGEARTMSLDSGGTCPELWMWISFVGDAGPVEDPGTVLVLPARVEIADGVGAIHGVAFRGRTVRIDEVGAADLHQAGPPSSCSDFGRSPRSS